MTQNSLKAWRAGRLKLALWPFLLGALTVLGFAPFYLYPLPFFTLAALFYLWLQVGSRRAGFWIGFMFGLGLFGAGVSWIYVSLHDFGMLPAPLAVLATLLLCAFLALFPALAGWVQAWWKGWPRIQLFLLMPAGMASADWIRSWIFTGFPWLSLGYSQAPNGPLAGYAAVLGVYGLSLLVGLSAALLTWLYSHRGLRSKQAYAAGAAVLLLWGIGFALQRVQWTQPIGAPVKVSLLQGNIAQDLKWREERLLPTLKRYRDLIARSSGRLIILPETAIPLFYDEVPSEYLAELAQLARDRGGDLVVGMPERNLAARQYYNSVMSLGSAPQQVYRKHHLVPFGEYIPLKPVFGWFVDMMQIPLGEFARGSLQQIPLAVASQQVAMNICYEDVFGEEIIRQLPQATLLANVSNDAWFGDSIAPRQHLQISQMRAMETGRTLLRATNTGMTAIVNEKGEVLAQAPVFQEAILEGTVQGRAGQTPYVRWGNTLFEGLIAFAFLLALVLCGVEKSARKRIASRAP